MFSIETNISSVAKSRYMFNAVSEILFKCFNMGFENFIPFRNIDGIDEVEFTKLSENMLVEILKTFVVSN